MSVSIIVGDAHLGKGISIGKPAIGGALNSRVADQFSLLEWVLSQALERNASAIFLTGDVCEEVKPDYIIMSLFIQWLKKCEVAGIEVHIVAGNHDIKRSGSYYNSALDIIQSAEIPNTHIHKQINTVYHGTCGFTLLPFRDRRSLNTDSAKTALEHLRKILVCESTEIPLTYRKVLIGHMALEGSIHVGDEIDDTSNELMCPPDMFSGYDYVWMGHVHKPQVLRKTPHVAHIGSMDISNFGETDHNKIIIVFDSQAKEPVQEIKIPTRPLRKLKIQITDNDNSTQKIIDGLIDLDQKFNLKNSILKIEATLCGVEVVAADRKRIEEVAYQLGIHHLCNFSESRTMAVVPLEKKADLNYSINPKDAVKMYTEYVQIKPEYLISFTKGAINIIDSQENIDG